MKFVPRVKDASFALCMWMTEHDVTLKALSAELGCCQQQLSRWRSGLSKPSRPYATKLEQLTAGRVPAAAWDAGAL